MRLDNHTTKRLYENAHDVQSGISETRKRQRELYSKLTEMTHQYRQGVASLLEEYNPGLPGGYKQRPPADIRKAPGVDSNLTLGYSTRRDPKGGEVVDPDTAFIARLQDYFNPQEFGPPGQPGYGEEEKLSPEEEGIIDIIRQIPNIFKPDPFSIPNYDKYFKRRPVIYKGEPGGGGLSGLDMMVQKMDAPSQGQPYQP